MILIVIYEPDRVANLAQFLLSFYINGLVKQLRNEGVQGIQVLHDSDSLITLLYADDVINLADTVHN